MKNVDLSLYKNSLSLKNQILRMFWRISWCIISFLFPRKSFNFIKILLLKLFGANIHFDSIVYSDVKIFMPWNLEMKEFSCLGPKVDCYNVAKIKIGANTTISQKTTLCSASHDITKINNPLITSPITIEDQVWVASEAFIGPGVKIGQGSVVGARSCVFKDIYPWTVVGGNPSKLIKNRIIQ
jgi:putative colanic acid biosynthesis acetyltransferase WcaF